MSGKGRHVMKRWMGKIVCAFLAAVLILLPTGCTQKQETDPYDYEVVWEDPTLEAVTRAYLGRGDSAPLLASDLKAVRLIVIKDRFIQFNNGDVWAMTDMGLAPVQRLGDLVHYPQLASVTISDTQLSDVAPLGELTDIIQLMLYNNPNITDISAFSNLTKMRVLVLYNNAISDYGPILVMRELRELDLRRNRLVSFHFDDNFPRLRVLKMDINSVSDLEQLKNLPNLAELDLHSNRISDLTPLSGLTGLLKLRLDSNRITDLTPLSGLEDLSLLDVSNNRLKSLDGVESLTNLVRLDITKNQITDLSAVRNLAKLQYLHAGDNQIANTSPLLELKNLKTIDLPNNRVTDLVQLQGLKAVKKLDISGNDVTREAVDELSKKLGKRCTVTFAQRGD